MHACMRTHACRLSEQKKKKRKEEKKEGEGVKKRQGEKGDRVGLSLSSPETSVVVRRENRRTQDQRKDSLTEKERRCSRV